MAKFENLGYCPNNAFGYSRRSFDGAAVQATETILGRRPVYMVYDQKDIFWSEENRDSIVDALYGGEGILGVQVSTYLEIIYPEPLEDKGEARKIIIHDVLNPKQMDEDILHFDDAGEEWEFAVRGGVDRKLKPTLKVEKGSTKKLFWDDRYLVCIQDMGGKNDIHIFLLRTQPASSGVYVDIGTLPVPDIEDDID